MKRFRATCTMFEHTETAEQVYKLKKLLKKIPRADSNRDSHARKRKRGESASPTNPDRVRTDKRKTKNEVSPSNKTTGADKTCLLHVPVNYLEECKLLKEYSKSTPRIIHKKIVNPVPAAKNIVIRPSISTAASRNPTSWNTMILLPRTRREKTDLKAQE